jgi:hypothetical protein
VNLILVVGFIGQSSGSALVAVSRFFVASPPVWDLFICAKHLFVAAMVGGPASAQTGLSLGGSIAAAFMFGAGGLIYGPYETFLQVRERAENFEQWEILNRDGTIPEQEPRQDGRGEGASVLAKAGCGLRLNEHLEHDDGELVFSHACSLASKAPSASGSARAIGLAGPPTG